MPIRHKVIDAEIVGDTKNIHISEVSADTAEELHNFLTMQRKDAEESIRKSMDELSMQLFKVNDEGGGSGGSSQGGVH